jgi:hypothetical protein
MGFALKSHRHAEVSRRALQVITARLAGVSITRTNRHTLSSQEVARFEFFWIASLFRVQFALNTLTKATRGITDVPAAVDMGAVTVQDGISARHTFAFVCAKRGRGIAAIF